MTDHRSREARSVSDNPGRRNLQMAERIGATPVRYPFSFVIAGDSGAWSDPTADAIYTQLLRQTARLTPAPVFFATSATSPDPGRASATSTTCSW
jgi:hypothetical protein